MSSAHPTTASPLPTVAQSAAPASGTDQTPERIRGMFSAITPSYDRLNHILSGWLDRRWRRRAARAALTGLSAPRRVLDVATGTGDLANDLQNVANELGLAAPGAPLPIVGADFTRPMLHMAQKKYGSANFKWVEADGTCLPFASGYFDAVTVAFGLRNMIDKAAALRELARVTRPGGCVVILEFGQPRNPVMLLGYQLYLFHILPRVGNLISRSQAYAYLAKSIRKFMTAAALRDAMQIAGLEKISYETLMGGVVYLHVGSKPL